MTSKLNAHELSLSSRGHRTEKKAKDIIQVLRDLVVPKYWVTIEVSVEAREDGWEGYIKYAPGEFVAAAHQSC